MPWVGSDAYLKVPGEGSVWGDDVALLVVECGLRTHALRLL